MMKLQQQIVGFNYEDHGNCLPEEQTFTSEDRQELLNEIKQLKAVIAKLEHSADTDPLVPVKNRRAFLREIERAQTVASRYDIPSSIIFFDLNKFKEINDDYGHGVGDELLIKIGKCLKASVRESDVVARLGGDEFGVILFKTDEQFAQTKAVILARQIANQNIAMQNGEIAVSAAWGTSPCLPDNSVREIMERADRAMYRNKNGAQGTRQLQRTAMQPPMPQAVRQPIVYTGGEASHIQQPPQPQQAQQAHKAQVQVQAQAQQPLQQVWPHPPQQERRRYS